MTCARLEEQGLLAELGGEPDPHVSECEECRARWSGYARLADMVASGATARAVPADWKERTLARVRAAARARRRRRMMRGGGLAVAAAAAALAIVLFGPRGPRPPREARLTTQIVDSGGFRGEAHVGDELRARAEPGAYRHFELRVYRGARELVARCPGATAAACAAPGAAALAWTIPAVGVYQVLLLVAEQPIPEPRGTVDEDVAAATAAGARVVDMQTVHVR
ncbi:MAG: hypothetical protein R3B48_10400 [Kofleriaceae bacterium]